MESFLVREQENLILSTRHQIIATFLQRRVKTNVDLQIPPKEEVIV